VRVTLGSADGEPGRGGDLVEWNVEGVLEDDDPGLRGRQLGKAATELEPGLRLCERPVGVAVGGDPRVLVERLCPALRRPPGLGDVLAGVDDETVQPGGELGLALELSDPLDELHERLLGCVARVLGVAQNVLGNSFHARSVPLAERRQRLPVSVLRTPHQNGIREPLVHERPVGPQVTHDSTGGAAGRLHAPTLVPMGLAPASVLPALRGSYGREYHYAPEAETTQRMLPANAAHGAVALTERQTAGRGRLGRTWADSGLMFSVALYPPGPVARWPELTLVAAEAVAAAVGPPATIKHPNDVLLDGRKVAGILAEASERVVLGIGINVGEAGWPGAGFVDRDPVELLADVLERLELGYDRWSASTSPPR
jgi:Biotin/lipoate A/B protein ligase family